MKVGKKKIFLGLGIAMAGLSLVSCGDEKTSNINEFDYVKSNNVIYELDSDSLEYGVYQIDSDYEGDVLKFESSFNGVPVTNIDGEYFDSNNDFSGVELPSTLKKIGAAAFVNFRNLTDITIPDSVEEIESAAFRGCSSLKNVKLNSGIKRIGSECFDSCTNLNYAIYNNGYYLGNSENPYLALIEAQDKAGFTIHEDTEIIADEACMDCTNITELTIPDSVKYIGADAFSGCNQMTNVNMSNNVISIGRGAFNRCEQLKKIELPSTIKSFGICDFIFCPNLKFNLDENENKYLGNSENPYLYLYDYNKSYIHEDTKIIGQYAFAHSDITGINIPYGVEIIESDAFIDCENLITISIPKSVVEIGDSAFSGCHSLKNVQINGSITEISDRLFIDCDSLEYVTIPQTVRRIGTIAFGGCTALRSFYSLMNLECISSRAFEDCISLKKVELFGCLTFIGDEAFRGCISFTSMTVPDNTLYLGDNAFFGCSRLAVLRLSNKIKGIGEGAFEYCDRLYSITYEGSLDDWNQVMLDDLTFNNSKVTKIKLHDDVTKKVNSNPYETTGSNNKNEFSYYFRDRIMEGKATLYATAPFVNYEIKNIKENSIVYIERINDYLANNLALGDVVLFYDSDTNNLSISRVAAILEDNEIVVQGDVNTFQYVYQPVTNSMSTEEQMRITENNNKLIASGSVKIITKDDLKGIVRGVAKN